ILPSGRVYVEALTDALIQDLLSAAGWNTGEQWTPLRRDLIAPVEDPGVRIEIVGPELAHVRATLQRASFDRSTFTEKHWHAMAEGLPYADARCLVAHDDQDNPVAVVT